MTGELDLRRLRELRTHLGEELPELVATLTGELEHALAAIDEALEAGDLAAAGLAAHAARNSALMIDARPTLHALDALESGARAADGVGARDARDRLRRHWPALRDALRDAAG